MAGTNQSKAGRNDDDQKVLHLVWGDEGEELEPPEPAGLDRRESPNPEALEYMLRAWAAVGRAILMRRRREHERLP